MNSASDDAKVVLFADDDEDDLYMCERALRKTGMNVDVRLVPSAQALIQWLEGDGHCADRQEFPLPDLIVTDLKTTDLTGVDVLQWINDHRQSFDIPIIVHTGSADADEKKQCMDLGAIACIAKEPRCTELTRTIIDLLHLHPVDAD